MRRLVYCFGAVVSMIAALLLLFQADLPGLNGDTPAGVIPTAPQIAAAAPDFSATSVDGKVINLADLRGQPVIINFWATWCAPCQVEMPILQRVSETHPHLRILAVNIGESPAVIRQWQQINGLTYDLLIDEQQAIATLYRLRGQPATYIVSPDGMITELFFGPVSEQALVAAINRL